MKVSWLKSWGALVRSRFMGHSLLLESDHAMIEVCEVGLKFEYCCRHFAYRVSAGSVTPCWSLTSLARQYSAMMYLYEVIRRLQSEVLHKDIVVVLLTLRRQVRFVLVRFYAAITCSCCLLFSLLISSGSILWVVSMVASCTTHQSALWLPKLGYWVSLATTPYRYESLIAIFQNHFLACAYPSQLHLFVLISANVFFYRHELSFGVERGCPCWCRRL